MAWNLLGAGSGESAYELAVINGYQGTLQEWLDSLKGEKGEDGKSVHFFVQQDEPLPPFPEDELSMWLKKAV